MGECKGIVSLKHVIIKRSFMDDRVTLGMLKVQDIEHDPIYTLENPWIGNQPWVSCITKGMYDCQYHNSPKYGKVFKVLDVPDRTDILFHPGNYERNTKGCILLGMGSSPMKGEPAIQNSRKAVEYFEYLIDGDKFVLNIQE